MDFWLLATHHATALAFGRVAERKLRYLLGVLVGWGFGEGERQ